MQKILSFLSELKNNNNREWFNDNKDFYKQAKYFFEEYVNVLILKIREFDNSIDVSSAKECVFRIYRDVRFAKNKEPYKTNFGAFIAKGGRKTNAAGYYFHVENEKSFAGGGSYMPLTPVLKILRQNVFERNEEFKSIIYKPEFIATFGDLWNDKLVNTPKTFPKDFVDAELLKYKSYVVGHNFRDSELLLPNLIDNISSVFEVQYPFVRFLNSCIK